MAYLRKEQETVEIDYSIDKVWKTIPKALKELGCTIEQIDDDAHHIKAKTQKGFVSWSSALLIDAKRVDENTTRVSVVAETPFTTITAIVDFGRARRRIDLFFATMAKKLTK
jgi:biotin operon repressor